MVVWLIGLSGSGKTTIGRHLYNIWKRDAANTVLVDGDEIREMFDDADQPSYSVDGRRANAERIVKLCTWLDCQDINVICCILSVFPDMRETNRSKFSRYFETYISTPMDILVERDTKGLYSAAISGKIKNVVGVDIEFIPPSAPDIEVNTGIPDADPKIQAHEIYNAIKSL